MCETALERRPCRDRRVLGPVSGPWPVNPLPALYRQAVERGAQEQGPQSAIEARSDRVASIPKRSRTLQTYESSAQRRRRRSPTGIDLPTSSVTTGQQARSPSQVSGPRPPSSRCRTP